MIEGVRVGSRLDMLRDLERRVKAEIKVEERLERAREKRRKRLQPREPDCVQQRLTELGVTAHDVKVWALNAGLIEEIRRGRVSSALVDSYAHAHTPQGETL